MFVYSQNSSSRPSCWPLGGSCSIIVSGGESKKGWLVVSTESSGVSCRVNLLLLECRFHPGASLPSVSKTLVSLNLAQVAKLMVFVLGFHHLMMQRVGV